MSSGQAMLRRSIRVVAFFLIAGLAPAQQARAQKSEVGDVTVFAAASLKNALDAAAANYLAHSGKKIVVSYAASSALAKQIEQGAPADIFISADLAWMDYVARAELIRSGTRTDLLGNRLVIVAPAASTVALDIKEGFPLTDALGHEGRLAVGDVSAVPAGKYAKAALEALKVWPSVEPRLAQAENVRAALALVSRGEVPLGIVYETDAAADKGVKIVGIFPATSHPPIVYPLAVLSSAKDAAAAEDFAAYLKSPAAASAFEKQGFTILK